MAEKRERPILFSAPMVRAILDGRKTQTRRTAIKDQLHEWQLCSRQEIEQWRSLGATQLDPNDTHVTCFADQLPIKLSCPYGKPGDRLWVRETWTGAWHGVAVHLQYAADGSERMAGEAPTEYVLPKAAAKVPGWVTPLFMPRWASRITLEITDVRVQRLQEITAEDCEAEGVFMHIAEYSLNKVFRDAHGPKAKQYFQELWQSINGEGSWAANPWVWALTFKRVQP